MKKKIIKKEEVLPAIEHKISAIEKACHFIVKPITKPRRKYDRKEVMRKAMLKYGIPALLLFVINTNSDAFFYVKFERGQTCCVYPQTSCDTIQTSCVSHLTSGVLHLTSGVSHLTSCVSHQTSCVLHLTSCALHQISIVSHQVKPNLQKEEYYLIMNSLTKLPFGKIKEYCVINTKQSQRFKLPLPEV